MDKHISAVIIDDNEMTRELLRTALRNDGYQVLGEATDGVSGLEMILRAKPDVVFLDILMPGASGLDVLQQVRQALPRCAVLMVTGSSDRDTVQTALARGAHGFILKPFNTATVLKTMDAAIARARGH